MRLLALFLFFPPHGTILTGVLTGTRSNNSLISSFSSATQPSVQSLISPNNFHVPPPWMKMSPPSLVFCGGFDWLRIAATIA